jgi:3-deoxy-7-phosphoheptulonate synthase
MLIFIKQNHVAALDCLRQDTSFICQHPDGKIVFLPEHVELPEVLNAHAHAIEILPKHEDYPFVAKRNVANTVKIADVTFGDGQVQWIAGPCSIEGKPQLSQIAEFLSSHKINLLRGGAFKPRTSPYSFQGLGLEGLQVMQDVAKQYGMQTVTELMDVRLLDTFLEADVAAIQIGSRNMQNYDLLRAVGQAQVPVILKRGLAATIKEWLLAAEYIAATGNSQIILCERGIRSFEPSYRNMLDITAIPVAKKETHLPVIVDPSHAAGRAELIPPLVKAAIAAGADGILVEVHPNPAEALSDKEQALDFESFASLLRGCAGPSVCRTHVATVL